MKVTTSMYILHLDFSPKKQVLSVGAYFRQKWVDKRLQTSEKEEDKDLVKKIKFSDFWQF